MAEGETRLIVEFDEEGEIATVRRGGEISGGTLLTKEEYLTDNPQRISDIKPMEIMKHYDEKGAFLWSCHARNCRWYC